MNSNHQGPCNPTTNTACLTTSTTTSTTSGLGFCLLVVVTYHLVELTHPSMAKPVDNSSFLHAVGHSTIGLAFKLKLDP